MDRADDWNSIAVAFNHCELDELFGSVDQLPIDQKAALVTHLLGDSGLSVVFAGVPLSGSAVGPINTTDRAAIGDLLGMIADRLRNHNL